MHVEDTEEYDDGAESDAVTEYKAVAGAIGDDFSSEETGKRGEQLVQIGSGVWRGKGVIVVSFCCCACTKC